MTMLGRKIKYGIIYTLRSQPCKKYKYEECWGFAKIRTVVELVCCDYEFFLIVSVSYIAFIMPL